MFVGAPTQSPPSRPFFLAPCRGEGEALTEQQLPSEVAPIFPCRDEQFYFSEIISLANTTGEIWALQSLDSDWLRFQSCHM